MSIAEDGGKPGSNKALVIETALIAAPDRANNAVFGRPLLERLMINCERAGIKRFVVAAPRELYPDVARAMGRFKGSDSVSMVESFTEILNHRNADGLGIDPSSPCVSFSGNLVIAKSQLARLLNAHASNPRSVFRTVSTDRDQGGEIATGPIGEILKSAAGSTRLATPAASLLPFALNGRPEDREEAELRLAKSIREESAHKDAPMARWVDRRISWRISYWLAQTRVTPNMVTVANTAFGLACGWMFSVPNYWMRLFAAIFFLISITIDGVDGELARLKMVESEFGGRLDVVTDNIVHVAVFVGLLIGCYRVDHSRAYLYLIPILLGGFMMCTYATWRAFKIRGEQAAAWLDKVDRWSGRDFAYLLVVLAMFNRLEYFAWGAAFGSYAFALVLIWITGRTASSISMETESL
ncbi:CDP-alcohol phosphatidyltransferase family protein [Candidatus Binatus sp.]|jgi:phosphatidylglycerophosphate synthase|uniref:CDP-alcohol phosphatidyltransferase family protein n=1 Tax=Candidatus Binatus sp. TaxID=2811406 RepID=UPI003C3EE5C9